jgi:hypothetical protein
MEPFPRPRATARARKTPSRAVQTAPRITKTIHRAPQTVPRAACFIPSALLLIAALVLCLSPQVRSAEVPPRPFGIQIIDSQSGRGVPCVRLETPDRQSYITDSAGWVAIGDPALIGQKVFFTLTSFGYEFPADGFGMHGTAIDIKPGATATLKIKRLNIAQRLYRTTGIGIYRDSILLGKAAPIEHPLINAKVAGQDSIQSAIYHDHIYFFWGDTSRLAYPLGLFRTAGATAELPARGGLDPAIGINYHYFSGPDGFARAMVPGKEPGAVWIDGVMVVQDPAGNQRMLADAARVAGLSKTYERFLLLWDDQTESFHKLKDIPLDAPLAPHGHPFRVKVSGRDYFYFPIPYPTVRVPATWAAVQDLSQYQAYTCLKPGKRYDKSGANLDRDARGNLNWAWKKSTPPLEPREIEQLIADQKIRRDQTPFRLADASTTKPILLAGGSVYWNPYLKKYLLIGGQSFGASMLGEIYLATADHAEGPWLHAIKIVTHDMEKDAGFGQKKHIGMDFYNPMQQPFFDQQNGKIIYFEGTYTTTFSGNPNPTPRYEYNNQMYRVDLSDPRLKPAE